MREPVVNVWRHIVNVLYSIADVNIHVGEPNEHGRPWFLFDGWQVTHGVFTLSIRSNTTHSRIHTSTSIKCGTNKTKCVNFERISNEENMVGNKVENNIIASFWLWSNYKLRRFIVECIQMERKWGFLIRLMLKYEWHIHIQQDGLVHSSCLMSFSTLFFILPLFRSG